MIKALLEYIEIMDVIPWVTTGRLNQKVNRWATLPDPAFRNLNDSFASTSGTMEQLEETVYVAGGNLDIDRIYTEDEGTIIDPRDNQVQMFMAAMSYMINDYFVNGDQAVDPAGFDGLKVRVGNLPSAQTIAAAASGLDVRASTANEYTFFDKLDQLIDLCEGHSADALLMNTNSRLGIRSALRRAGLFETTTDQFDREVMSYRGCRIIDMGTTKDQTTNIITQTETQGGSGAVSSSIYAVKWGKAAGEMLHGIQMHPLRVTDIGLLENGAQKRTNIEWPLGLAMFHPRAAARLTGVLWTT